jgi:hypothetical protein
MMRLVKNEKRQSEVDFVNAILPQIAQFFVNCFSGLLNPPLVICSASFWNRQQGIVDGVCTDASQDGVFCRICG